MSIELVSGAPVPEDGSHRQLKENGQQRDYVVLSQTDLAKGYIQPYRDSYVHDTCGVVTKMGHKLSATYAADPWFYSGTFCVGCQKHFPLDQFHWSDGAPMDPEKWSAQELENVMRRKGERDAPKPEPIAVPESMPPPPVNRDIANHIAATMEQRRTTAPTPEERMLLMQQDIRELRTGLNQSTERIRALEDAIEQLRPTLT